MVQTVLIVCGPEGAAGYAAALAARSGSDIGLVATGRDPAQLKASGRRIEEDRDYGGRVLSAFDEPLAVGSAVAQLAGHADAVVVDRLDTWAARLASHFAGDAESIDAEITALRSVMSARLLDLFLVTGAAGDGQGSAAALLRRILKELEPLCHAVVEMTDGAPRTIRGELPG